MTSRIKPFIRFRYSENEMGSNETEEEFAICVECGNPLEKCQCVCPFCGERDKCECALFDAATGG